MTSARTIRKNHKTRTFVSKRYVWPDGVWGPWRNGLAYGDVRSHQKRRHAPVGAGTRALNTLPCDALHLDRKEQKKEIAAQHSANKRRLRELAKLKSDRAKKKRKGEHERDMARRNTNRIPLPEIWSVNPMTSEDFKKFKDFMSGNRAMESGILDQTARPDEGTAD